jgi:hypothetical protein
VVSCAEYPDRRRGRSSAFGGHPKIRCSPVQRRIVAAFIITRIQTGDYDVWRPMFDSDRPNAREKARSVRVLRSVDDPNHVFVQLEFDSVEDAQEARDRVVSSGVLDRFADTHGPNVLVEA